MSEKGLVVGDAVAALKCPTENNESRAPKPRTITRCCFGGWISTMVLVGPPETSWASEGLFSRPNHQIHWKLHNQDTKTLSNRIIMESFIVSKDKTDRDGHSLSGKKIKRVSRKRRKLPIIEFCVVVRRLQDAQAARDAEL